MTDRYMELTAPVFNVQTYSIHDGPGIRVTVFVKGCPLRCRWCANPESNLARPQLMTYAAKCTACGRCVAACPQKAVSIGTLHDKPCAITDRELCVECGVCVDVCPCEAREIVGREKTVREVLEQVLKDKLFIDASGGGMTVSGGECLAHPDFTEALLYAAKEQGLHTAIESSSFASEAVFDQVLRYVDLALLDIKHMDSDIHRELTGVPNEQILSNIRHAVHDLKKNVTVRVPTIPGYNDSEENIRATARFVKEELGPDVGIHLLPYHRLGESKNESLGKVMDLSVSVPSDEHMQDLKRIVESYGLYCQIGG
ncbi:MAG: glycyl-radical enzyme activating protein [Oscillospiraceae bacterium]|nr:glycyl-radical enzyme activating protein [Oscillospiraceae bacterium]